MSSHKSEPPWEFLRTASVFSLQSYELSRLNHAANLKKEINQLIEQWLEENACAMVARWLMDRRQEFSPAGALAPPAPFEEDPEHAATSYNLLGRVPLAEAMQRDSR